MSGFKIKFILFKEKDIANTKAAISEWEGYTDGHIDLGTKFQHILDDAKSYIQKINESLALNETDITDVYDGYVDMNYYECDWREITLEKFAVDYSEIIYSVAQRKYEKEIEAHSPEAAKKQLKILKIRLERLESDFKKMMDALSPAGMLELEGWRNGKYDKPPRKSKGLKGVLGIRLPSDVFMDLGNNVIQGMTDGIEYTEWDMSNDSDKYTEILAV